MDVIDEESSGVGSSTDIPDVSSRGASESEWNQGVSLHASDVDESESTEFSEEDAADFAKTLKRHRKALLDGDGRPQKQEDFSQKLRKHRDHLVNSWDHEEEEEEEEMMTPTLGTEEEEEDSPNPAIQSIVQNNHLSNGHAGATNENTTVEKSHDNEFGDLSVPPKSAEANQDNGPDLLGDIWGDVTATAMTSQPAQNGDPHAVSNKEECPNFFAESMTEEKSNDMDLLGGGGDFGDTTTTTTANAATVQPDVWMNGNMNDVTNAVSNDNKEQNASDMDVFGDMLVAAPENSTSETVQSKNNNTTINNDFDLLGGFHDPITTTIAPPESLPSSTNTEPEDDKPSHQPMEHNTTESVNAFDGLQGNPTSETKDDNGTEFFDAFEQAPSVSAMDETVSTNDVTNEQNADQICQTNMAMDTVTELAETSTNDATAESQSIAPTNDGTAEGKSEKDVDTTQTKPTEKPGEEPEQTEDLDFGDFSEAITDVNQANSGQSTEDAATKQGGNNNDEDFGDFGDATVPNSSIEDKGQVSDPVDDFGDFGQSANDATSTVAANDDFGTFNEATTTMETVAGEPQSKQNVTNNEEVEATIDVNAAADMDDDRIVAKNHSGKSDRADSEMEELGDFVDATNGAQESCVELQAVDRDDEFGDFGDAATSSHAPTANNILGNGGEPQAVDMDDEFGDFGEATTTSHAPTDGSKQTSEQEQKEINNDEFGDFGGASGELPSISVGQELPTASPDVDEDVEFGDFDDATSDFQSAPAQPEAPVATQQGTEDEDFGEFDEAAAPSQQPSSSQKEEPDDDDFGDFGDFGDASAPAETPTDDDFGDFGEADIVSPKDDKSLHVEALATSLRAGPQFQRAQMVFARIRNKCAFEESPATSCTEDAVDNNVTVKSLMESLSPNGLHVEAPSEICTGNVVPDHPCNNRNSDSNLIIFGDGLGPDAHFAYPIGGHVGPEDDAGSEMVRKRASALASYVPDVLPIQLPTGKEALLDRASPEPIRPLTESKKSPAPMPKLETRNTLATKSLTPENEKKVSYDAGARFMDAIPDLSFMLKTALSLPTK